MPQEVREYLICQYPWMAIEERGLIMINLCSSMSQDQVQASPQQSYKSLEPLLAYLIAKMKSNHRILFEEIQAHPALSLPSASSSCSSIF